MKTLMKILFATLLCLPFTLSAQWTDYGSYIRTNDNVGIGVSNNTYTLYARTNKTGWQGRFANRGGSGSDVYLAHGGGYGMHIRGWTTDSKYTLQLYNATAQTNVFYNNGNAGLGLVGNVGIGTTAPSYKLHVAGSMYATGWIRSASRSYYFGDLQTLYGDNSSALYWDSNHSTISQIIVRDKENTKYGHVYGSGNGVNFGLLDGDGNWSYLAAKDNYTAFRINNSEKMRISTNGRVNIVTTRDATGTAGSGALEIGNALRIDNNEIITNTNTALYLQNDNNGDVRIDGNTLMVDASTNRVGIGTTTPDNKLDVLGTIRSTEVKVESGWSDYVFYDDYQLPTLNEEKQHIEAKGHLLGFESEQDMEGMIHLGDVSRRQQAKIEEMMLHLIQISEELQTVHTKVSDLEQENTQLKKQLADKK